MLVLAMDASIYTGTVALLRNDSLVGDDTARMRGEHEERLLPALAGLLDRHGIRVDDVDAVACGSGPGSFTSLRIAASIAKGLAAARQLPLYVAPSPLLVVTGAEPALAAGRYVAALDAMRGELFAMPVELDETGTPHPLGVPVLERREAVESRAESLGATLVGPLQEPPRGPHARGFATLFRHGLVTRVDLAGWEPDYGRKAEAQVRWEQLHGRPLEVR